MSLGLFDVVGPVMHGPSSSHTAAAVRIGYIAQKIMGGAPEKVTFEFHPMYMPVYKRHGTDAGLMAGCLGLREDDPSSVLALKQASDLGIQVCCRAVQGGNPHRNLMRILALREKREYSFNAVSTGGGNFIIDNVCGMDVRLDGNHPIIYARFDELDRMERAQGLLSGWLNAFSDGFSSGRIPSGGWQIVFWLDDSLKEEQVLKLKSQDSRFTYIPPLFRFCDRGQDKPLFSTFAEFLALCENEPAEEICIRYEQLRSGCSKEEILGHAERMVEIVRTSLEEGLQGKNDLIDTFATGFDAQLLLKRAGQGGGILGPTFTLSLARAVALAERNAARGRIIASPSGGAAGVLGVLLTISEKQGKSDRDLAKAFLVAAGMGVIIGNKASFSGAVGGCQGEIGVGAAIGAAGAAYLSGGGASTIVESCALVLKNVLGLTCDPPGGTVEVPCIKRNALAASLIFMGAEMALAGVKSVIPPDEVIIALADTQRRLPSELKGGCGGLAGTFTGQKFRENE